MFELLLILALLPFAICIYEIYLYQKRKKEFGYPDEYARLVYKRTVSIEFAITIGMIVLGVYL